MSTIRRRLIELLRQDSYDALELSQLLSIREKEVYSHLPHISRTLAARKERLVVTPYHCLSCDYRFGTRSRFDRPGRCPRCRGEHIRMARYTIA